MHGRDALAEALQHFKTDDKEEQTFPKRFLELLKHPRAYFRDHQPGHITGSAWIIDHDRQFVLLTHHAKLNRWLQPGGHADGDEDIQGVALREAREETGLQSLKLIRNNLFDIDIHAIPARGDLPEHLHYDIRFLIEASKAEKIIVSEESHDLAWVPLGEIPAYTQSNLSMLRMAAKTKKLFRADQQ
jgi:8-oxo-dGTP pyrophosphatase MutT (NUDIX family)